MAEVEIQNVEGETKVVLDADSGLVKRGGHKISEKDFCFLIAELREQFCCMSGRLYSLIEELGLSEKQEAAAKRHCRAEVWERFNDYRSCMETFSVEGKYKTSEAFTQGEPSELESDRIFS